MVKFKLMKNTFSVYVDIFNSGILLISSDQGHLTITKPHRQHALFEECFEGKIKTSTNSKFNLYFYVLGHRYFSREFLSCQNETKH